jgi:hypothetical protein
MLFATSPTAEQGQKRGLDAVSTFSILLNEVLPVLTHAASQLCWASSLAQGTHDTLSQHALLQASTTQPGAAVSVDLLAAQAASGSDHRSSVPPAVSHTLPVESTLLLLRASANLLRLCVPLAVSNKDACSTLSRSSHLATHTPPKDDLVAALGAVLALASDLVSGGPWWQQAKAHHCLALIDALYDTSVVRGGLCLLHWQITGAGRSQVL